MVEEEEEQQEGVRTEANTKNRGYIFNHNIERGDGWTRRNYYNKSTTYDTAAAADEQGTETFRKNGMRTIKNEAVVVLW